jgi:hypothetical protein
MSGVALNQAHQTHICQGNFVSLLFVIFVKSWAVIDGGSIQKSLFGSYISFSLTLVLFEIKQNSPPNYDKVSFIPMAVRAKAKIRSRLIAGIAGSNPDESSDIRFLCSLCVV